jgi:hypothetical protein
MRGKETMIRQALEYLVGLGKTEILEVDGQKYSTKGIQHIKYPSPAALSITTLTGLVDYIKSDIDLNAKLLEVNNDSVAADDLLIQVISPTEVRLLSPILADEKRDCYIECTALTPSIKLNQFVDPENFNIMMQSCFVPNGDLGAILKVVGNIKEEQVREVGDDGVSQEVTAKIGIAKVGSVTIPNPVMLKPYRTFTEIEQPESQFVFRMQTGPRAALYEADGGAWRSEAMKNVKAYLKNELQGYSVKVIS